jgi:hypothetical protein
MNPIVTISIMFLPFSVIMAQVNQEWTARYNITSSGYAGSKEILVDKMGDIIVTGSSDISGSSSEYTTIKYNTSGIQQWVASYNGLSNGYNNANAMIIDNSDDVIVTGSSQNIGTGEDFATIKYNSSGVQQWVARYSSTGNYRDAAYGIAVDNSDNVYVTGESNNSLTVDYVTIKYNSSGVEQWIKKYIDGIAYSIAIDNSGNVFVTGVNSGNIATLKYTALGVQEWIAIYNGPMNRTDVGERIAVDKLGNIYVSGSSIGALNYYDYVTIKYSPSGKEQWVRRYEGSGQYFDEVHDMVIDESCNIYITGNSTETGAGYDYTTIKYNTNGDQLWIAKYNYSLNDIAFAITLDNYDNVYVTGQSEGEGGLNNFATVKYDSSGVQQWSQRYFYSESTDDHAYAIAVDKNGSVYITGQSNRDILTIKYSQPTGVNPIKFETPSEFKLDQNYPNPFNPKTVINYQLPYSSEVRIKIYNVLGNEIETLVNEKQNSGSYSVTFDGSVYLSGVFLYRLEVDGNIIDTKRMILLK